MKRRAFINKFLLSIFGLSSATTILKASDEIKEEYSFDEIFHRPHNNDRLLYLRSDSEIYLDLRKTFSDRLLPEDKFSAYLPKRDFVFPIKDRYVKEDFNAIKHLINKMPYDRFCEYEQGVFFRFTIEGEFAYLNFYWARD